MFNSSAVDVSLFILKALQQKGIIQRIGPAKGGYWKVLSDEISDKALLKYSTQTKKIVKYTFRYQNSFV